MIIPAVQTGSPWRATALCVLFAILVGSTSAVAGTRVDRVLAVAPSVIDSSDSIRRTVEAAAANGFDVLVVPVSLFADRPEERDFDWLGTLIRRAHDHGMRVHASISATLGTAVDEIPASRTHVIYEHPEWLMVPRELAPEILAIDPRAPDYLGRLMRWTRAHRDRVPALVLSPLLPASTSFLTDAVRRVLERYELDGVQLDGLRYPGDDFDYSPRAVHIFRTHLRQDLSGTERTRMDEVEALDPFAYMNEYPEAWQRFRRDRLTALVAEIRAAVVTARPSAIVSATVAGEANPAIDAHREDWQRWLDAGLIDAVSRTVTSRTTELVYEVRPDATSRDR